MRQVPTATTFLIIGNGRVARHFCHYFSLLKLNVLHWYRQKPLSELHALLAEATHVLILISDNAIEPFLLDNLRQIPHVLVHCSGSLVSRQAYGAHPLFPFTDGCYDLATYQKIPFVIDDDAPPVAELLPGVPNQSVRLASDLKAKYHALCVMGANFSCLLWQKLFATFEQEFNIPRELAMPLLLQQTANLYQHPFDALTGPLTRGDRDTIRNNLTALEGDPFQKVYQSFIQCYAQLSGRLEHEQIRFL